MPRAAAADFLAGRPWRFTELLPPALEDDWDMVADDRENFTGDHGEILWTEDEVPTDHTSSSDGASDDHLPGETRRLYTIGVGGNPSYEAPRMRYSFASYTRPGELHEIDPATGEDALLKRATVLGNFNPRDYMERRVWITARDGERIPVSLVWHRDCPAQDSPMFITGYGAYEISSDPGFSVSRLSMLDRGVLYAVPHIRGGGEMGRAWYEQGRRLNKKHSFEDFVDATRALQKAHLADAWRTVANGGSAGGLLMGAIANMAPFITTSMNDTRVLYVEPLKWLARLQSAGVDAVAKIEVEAGHGGLSGRYKQWEEVSYENAWCMDVMGLAH